MLHSPTALTPTVEPSDRSSDALARIFTQTPAPGTYFAQGTSFWDVARQYVFRFAADDLGYLFVQWVADSDGHEAFCQFRYSLIELGASPKPLGATGYGCDI